MSSQKDGLTFEKDVAADLHENTDALIVFGGGMSGNVRIPQPDLLIVDDGRTYAIELKRSTADRFYIEFGDKEELSGVRADEHWFAHKFTNRELAMWQLGTYPPDPFDGHVTNVGSLRLDKPSTDEWSSARSGRPAWVVIAATLGISY